MLKQNETTIRFYDIKFNNNVLLEINGDYWHANPLKYNETDIIKKSGKTLTAKEIWNYDFEKMMLAKENSYTVMYIWESQMSEMTDNEILQWIKSNCLHQNIM